MLQGPFAIAQSGRLGWRLRIDPQSSPRNVREGPRPRLISAEVHTALSEKAVVRDEATVGQTERVQRTPTTSGRARSHSEFELLQHPKTRTFFEIENGGLFAVPTMLSSALPRCLDAQTEPERSTRRISSAGCVGSAPEGPGLLNSPDDPSVDPSTPRPPIDLAAAFPAASALGKASGSKTRAIVRILWRDLACCPATRRVRKSKGE